MTNYANKLAEQFGKSEAHIANIISLVDEGNTIPFIARYRKEMHGSMDDQLIREIVERLTYLRNLDTRREEIRSAIEALGKLTDEINEALDKAQILSEIEDIYRPYKQKRKTRASVAREKGLEPLALTIYEQESDTAPIDLAKGYINEELGVENAEDALQGALDIIAENISDDAECRKRIRNLIRLNGSIVSEAVDKEKESVYTNYYDYKEPISKIAHHRVLALNRGEDEEFLKVKIEVNNVKQLTVIKSLHVKGTNLCSEAVFAAGCDAYERLIFPSVEREIRNELTDAASEQAIALFGTNLRQLLMQPPVKGKIAIGLDPGYRTGCKLAVIDPTGRVLDTAVIYPTHSKEQIEKSKAVLADKIKKYGVQIIAIGNGTASKETEIFTAEVIKQFEGSVAYMVVSEAGASVYSASKLAAAEMPDFDLTLRSAVSIARRLQDPLAELVKIDPKAIGVGQYQHDMPPKRLSETLDGVVESCVNSVGADLNTASASLLEHIAGLSAVTSKNIVAYREENGAFKSRAELKKVAKIGPKAYEQCAGFLRVTESREPLDATSVHPESYAAAEKLLEICGYTKKDVKDGTLGELELRVNAKGVDTVAAEIGIGVPTLTDIVKELMKPGRDIRDELPPPMLRTDVLGIDDLKEGMVMKGTVRNVIDFGAFVDIGVHQDGLVHISQICSKFIKHPSEMLKVGDVVNVKILAVDKAKMRISLTMKDI